MTRPINCVTIKGEKTEFVSQAVSSG
jgi:hypothetical protein